MNLLKFQSVLHVKIDLQASQQDVSQWLVASLVYHWIFEQGLSWVQSGFNRTKVVTKLCIICESVERLAYSMTFSWTVPWSRYSELIFESSLQLYPFWRYLCPSYQSESWWNGWQSMGVGPSRCQEFYSRFDYGKHLANSSQHWTQSHEFCQNS